MKQILLIISVATLASCGASRKAAKTPVVDTTAPPR